MPATPKVLLIIPTHEHPGTLPFALRSAVNQTFQNLEITVIGDGVSDKTRRVMDKFLASDSRISFLDMPKAARHGEEYRDQVIKKSNADYVTYLGDDDLLFSNHIDVMLEAVQGVDFANPLPIFIEPDGNLSYLATDLAIPESLNWHLSDSPLRNSVSLTGVIHTRSSYLRLPFGWRPAPIGIPSDLYMWHQYFQLVRFSAKTSQLSTTAKFANSSRIIMSEVQRTKELRAFEKTMKNPNFNQVWSRKVQACVHIYAVHKSLGSEFQVAEISSLNKDLNQILNSRTWVWSSPLRKLLSKLFK